MAAVLHLGFDLVLVKGRGLQAESNSHWSGIGTTNLVNKAKVNPRFVPSKDQ